MNKKKNIIELWKQVFDKQTFILDCADFFGRSTGTVRNHWFTKFDIPKEFEDQIISMLQKKIAIQNQLQD